MISAKYLRKLAEAEGIQTAYTDMAGNRCVAKPEVVSLLIRSLGTPVSTDRDAARAVAAIEERRWTQCIEPVYALTAGKSSRIRARLPVSKASRSRIFLQLEEGVRFELSGVVGRPPESVMKIGRADYGSWPLSLPQLPMGYHSLNIECGELRASALLLVAPERFYEEPEANRWGIFIPGYAAHSASSWGGGNFSDWRKLVKWTGSLGGQVFGMLPLAATFSKYPTSEPSPYSPASRLFWNEYYVDIESLPEFQASRKARGLVASSKFRARLTAFRGASLIDYEGESAIRRQVLQMLADEVFKNGGGAKTELDAFAKTQEQLIPYAKFRATCDTLTHSWHTWPARLRKGVLEAGDYAEGAYRYHLFSQWCVQRQMDVLQSDCEASNVFLYLDLPLGVNSDGYDRWKYSNFFVGNVNTGAPPDPFFTKGQDWGFSPLHPRRTRELHYDYVIRYLRFQMRHAGMLRVDHVMGLHRLYWVPQGSQASDGAYVRYPAEELYAILSIESHRNKTSVVGENLGTVPPEVNRAMDRHRMGRMFVVQYEERDQPPALPEPPRSVVASLNTHDMPMFAAHWKALDVEDRKDLGLLDESGAAAERNRRAHLRELLVAFLKSRGLLKGPANPRSMFEACVRFLAVSKADTVLINLEDLWGELQPQNVPGTSKERPNWRRKTQKLVEEVVRSGAFRRFLAEVDGLRRKTAA